MKCCIYLFPDIPVTKNYKTKENTVVDKIKEAFPDLSWIHDKKVQDGCSKRRPDLLVDLGSHVLIIEVDENKHNDYDCSCENKRLMEISQDVGHRPLVFLRFNPDGYTDQNGNQIKSCWAYSRGIAFVPKTQIKNWENRIKCLIDTITYWIENPTDKTVEIVELFY